VASTAEATIRVYDVLARLPNGFPTESRHESDEVPEVRLAPVRYRDAPGPRYAGIAASGMPLQEAILRTLDVPASEASLLERSLSAERGGVDVTVPPVPPEPLPHDHGPDLDGHDELPSGHLHRHGHDTYLYPEWDAVAGRYLPDWCLLRVGRPRIVQRPVRPVPSRHLLPELVRQLERIRPAGRDFVPRMPSGDDLDLDACVEAIVDLRAGVRPSERIFVDVVERRRDVAVAFALDLSSSTAERLSGPTRIIDLQRDAVSLLVEALERVGDAYGIYGFSGGGRDDVRLSVVKDLEERRSPAMLHRLAGLTPDHTTRMGPPIRHLTSLLERSEASTKILLIISDGRPFDLDYGQQYGDEAVLTYAVADTARAMDEARSRGVRPYLITVDPAGGDYLSQICDPQEYHVISDARDLPSALAQLYLVARSQPARPESGPRRPAR
jgi:nitric oxide reductase activation protein